MSDFDESAETGREHLRRTVASLPPHEPDVATWPRIAAQLDAEHAIANALPTLTIHEPDPELWAAIASRLDAAPTPAVTPLVRPLWPARTLWWVAGVAASVLLLLGVWWRPALPGSQAVAAAPRGIVTFSEEEVAVPVAPIRLATAADPLAQEGKAFIDAHCTSLPTVCQTDEFQDLRTQLTEVEAQERRLRQDAQRFGASPALLRQQVQLTVLQAEITRELVQLLIS